MASQLIAGGVAIVLCLCKNVKETVNNSTSAISFPIGILAVFEMCLFLSVFGVLDFFTGSDSLLKLNRWL